MVLGYEKVETKCWQLEHKSSFADNNIFSLEGIKLKERNSGEEKPLGYLILITFDRRN